MGLWADYEKLVTKFSDLHDDAESFSMASGVLGAVVLGAIGLIYGYQSFGVGAGLGAGAVAALVGGSIGLFLRSILRLVIWFVLVVLPVAIVVGLVAMIWNLKF